MSTVLLALALFQDPGNDRSLTPEQLEKRKESLYKEAEEARKKLKSWKAKIGASESVGGRIYSGEIWAKAFGENDWGLFISRPDSRVLCRHTSLDRTVEEVKVLQKYDLTDLNDFLPESLLRDGITKALEERFEVKVTADARFMKLQGNAEDWAHLGFKNEEEFKAWMDRQSAKGTGGVVKEGLKEFGTFDDRAEEFHKNSGRSMKPPPKTDGRGDLYFDLVLTQKEAVLARKIQNIVVRLRAVDFLPIRVQVNFPGNILTIGISEIERDLKEEIADTVFTLDVPDYTVEYPQKD
jgi:ribosomal protein L9